MINKLQINNFRNYEFLRIDFQNKNIVVFCGNNGEGKTNILETISLFGESNGLRSAKYQDMVRRSSESEFWNIGLETDTGYFSTSYNVDELGKKHKIYKVNDKLSKNLSEFLKEHYIVWMTYETDRLFLESPSQRRQFIDMFTSVRFPDHQKNLRAYERLARERLKILKEHCEKGFTVEISRWLDIIESKISDLGLLIGNARNDTVRSIEKEQLKDKEFPEFRNEMFGNLESLVLNLENDSQKQMYLEELKSRRQKDGFSGMTTLGPNRSDWKVHHTQKDIAAERCSAGEQKMLLCGIFLSFIIGNLEQDQRNLIVLLDDVIAHLDDSHRQILFEYIKHLSITYPEKVSFFLSGVNKALFEELYGIAEFFEVSNSNCSIIN